MEPQMEQGTPQGNPEQEGRGGDTVMAHLSLGELVIPRAFLDDPDVMQAMQDLFKQAGANINQYIVGDPANSINPETGYPEFGFFKSIFKAVKKYAIPAALAYFAPGIGSALGASSAFAPIVGGAVAGAGSSALNGGNIIKGGLTGAAAGGIASAANGGFNNTLIGRGISDAANSVSSGIDAFGNKIGIGDIIGHSQDSVTLPGIGQTGLSNGTGIKGLASGISNAVSSNAIPAANSVTGAGSSAYGGSTIGNVLGAASSIGGQDEAAKKLLEQQQRAEGAYAPYLNQEWNPGDLTQDPGYQFQQQQGEQALARKNAASGSTFSGAALKDAAAFNQGLASTTANDSYNRWLQTQRQGLTAAGAVNGVYDNVGNIQANKINANSNTFNDTLSRILGGGAVSQAAPDGYEYVNGVLKKKVTA